ncbi:MAG: hypothetical protein ACI9W6_001787 [Motiliproteus sp.]|jgi:hypothetical protein
MTVATCRGLTQCFRTKQASEYPIQSTRFRSRSSDVPVRPYRFGDTLDSGNTADHGDCPAMKVILIALRAPKVRLKVLFQIFDECRCSIVIWQSLYEKVSFTRPERIYGYS